MLDKVTPLLRLGARLPGLRRIRRTRSVSRIADALYHSRLVDEQVRFFVAELHGRPHVGRYRPRGSLLDVYVRHQTSDRYILDEVFGKRLYELPAGARAALLALGRPPRGVDLGGHIGLFGAFFFSLFPDGELDAFEPDPRNADVLRRCITVNGLTDRWRLTEAAAAGDDGNTFFLSGRFAESHVAAGASGAVEVPTRDVLPLLLEADLIKIDIEGSEWRILGDPRLQRIPARVVALEYHPEGSPEPDTRAAARQVFERLGFVLEEIDVPYAPSGVGMLWAWRPATDHERSTSAPQPRRRSA